MVKGNHASGKLSAVSLKKLKDGWHADGGNLYLLIRGQSRAWVFRYVSPITKKRTSMGLGSLENFGLAEARQRAAAQRAKVKDPLNPVDPIEERDKARDQTNAKAKKRTTFKQAAERYIESKQAEWSNDKHKKQWASTLESWVYPHIGNLPTELIETSHILKVLQQDVKDKDGSIEGSFWNKRTETASRVRERMEAVLGWAKASKLRTGENPAAWKENLENLLSSPKKTTKVKNQPSLPYQQVGDFMLKLKTKEGVAAKALEFLIMTGVRSESVRKATWDQIDFEELVWSIPDENTKMKVAHKVPLTAQMVSLLQALPTIEGNNYIFYGSAKAILSDSTLSKIMRAMLEKGEILEKAVPHGFRATSRTWAAEQTSFPDEVRKAFSMHAVSDSVLKAYQRTDFFDKRRELTEQWCNYLDQPSIKKTTNAKNNVLPIKSAA